MEPQPVWVYTTRATSDHTGELPTQEDPGIDQNQTDTQQEEAQSWVPRRGSGSDTAQQTITAFDAETTSIALIDLARSPVRMNDNVGQPGILVSL